MKITLNRCSVYNKKNFGGVNAKIFYLISNNKSVNDAEVMMSKEMFNLENVQAVL